MTKIIFLVLTIFPSFLFSQGAFLEKDQNGFSVTGAYSSNKDASGFGIGIGYSFNAIVDLGFTYSKSTTDDDPELSGNFFSPSINIHVLKQNNNLPIALSLGASYSKGSYSSDLLDDLEWDLTSNGFSIGGNLFSKMKVNQSFSIMPMFGVSYYSITGTIEDSFGNSEDDDDSGSIISIGIPFIFNLESTNLFIVAPGLSINDNTNTFSIEVSIIIPN